MAVELGSIIWTAVRAILKFVFTAACGTFLAKAKYLDSQGTRAISQCILNVFLPCLVFTKIVQGIDQDLMKQVGILALTAIMYTVLGLLSGYVVRLTTKVPPGWKYGVLAAGAYSNWGDLPLVLIGTIVTAPPFDSTTDQAKGLAYVAVYIFVQSTIMFALNGIRLIAKDYDEDVSVTVSRGFLLKTKDAYKFISALFQGRTTEQSKACEENTDDSVRPSQSEIESDTKIYRSASGSSMRPLRPAESLGVAPRTSNDSLYLRPITSGVLQHGDLHSTIEMAAISRIPSTLPRHNAGKTETPRVDTSPHSSKVSTENVKEDDESTSHKNRKILRLSRLPPWSVLKVSVKAALLRFLSPPSIATISGFIIAVIPQVKALFVVVDGVNMPAAPDGKPPLDFIIDTTNFIGGASVPCSLLILGYSLSRLNVTKVPALSSAVVMALLKMVVLPIIAIAWMQFLARDLIDPSDLVLRLVLVLPAAVPTATSLLYITSILAPEGQEANVQYLSVFLVVQYLMVGLTLTITVVYTLNKIT